MLLLLLLENCIGERKKSQEKTLLVSRNGEMSFPTLHLQLEDLQVSRVFVTFRTSCGTAAASSDGAGSDGLDCDGRRRVGGAGGAAFEDHSASRFDGLLLLRQRARVFRGGGFSTFLRGFFGENVARIRILRMIE